MEKYGFVYETTNQINGMKCIGKCIYGRKNNWETYLGSGVYLKRAIKKYGKNNFTREILEDAYSDEELNELEEKYIGERNAVESTNYYNIKFTSIGEDVYTNNPRKEEIRKMKSYHSSGERNPQYGKPKTEKMINSVKKSNSRKVRVDGVTYRSQSEACRELGIKTTTLNYRLNSDNYPTYERLAPKNDYERRQDYSKQYCKVSIDGYEYPSIKIASEKTGIPASTIARWSKSDNHPNIFRL